MTRKNATLNEATNLWGSWLGYWRGAFGSTTVTSQVRPLNRRTKRAMKALKKQRNPPPELVPYRSEPVVITRSHPVQKNDPKETAIAPKPVAKIKQLNLKDAESRKKFKALVQPEEVYKGVPEDLIENPEERRRKIEAKQEKKKLRLFQPAAIGKYRRMLLWVNPGTEKLAIVRKALQGKGELPRWANRAGIRDLWALSGAQLMFAGLPVADDKDKREAVRALYYNPKEPSTIHPITDKLRGRFANVSRGDVTKILRSFETYQLNFRRRLPAKVNGRMTLNKPGTILCDMFFPSAQLGWQKYSCLTLMDGWSRYVRCYALKRKSKKFQQGAALDFFQNFAALGHLPRILLMDKGTDISGVKEIALRYRTDPTKKMIFHSQTGQPVNLVEQTQSQIQRRMQVFRTAGLTDDPREILEDICEQINNQRRPERGNLTPMQLLTLNKTQRTRINAEYGRKDDTLPAVKGLRELFRGSRVRVLMMTRKEQITGALKGFTPKWSRDVYTIKKKVALAGNPNNFRFHLHGDSESYFRHELLWVPRKVDSETIDFIQKMEIEELDDDEYNPAEDG